MTERVCSSGRTGRGKLGGRLPDTAPPARPRVSHRLLGGKGLSLRAPGPQSPPCRGSLPHCDPDTQRPAAGGPATLSGARPFFTQSSKHSCTSGVSAAGGPPPRGSRGGWAAGASGLTPLPLGTGRGGLSIPCPASSKPSALHGRLTRRCGGGGRPETSRAPRSGLHNTHLHLKGDLSHTW